MGLVVDEFVRAVSPATGKLVWVLLHPATVAVAPPPYTDPAERVTNLGVDIPTALNTGVPAGQRITGTYGPGQSFEDRKGNTLTIASNGLLTITTAGADLFGLELKCAVNVRASNVSIARCLIHPPAAWTDQLTALSQVVYFANTQTGGLIKDCEVYADSPSDYTDGIKILGNATARRNNVHDVTDTMLISGANITAEGNYLHDNRHWDVDRTKAGGPSHDDGFQDEGGDNHRVVGNLIPGAVNSAIQITQNSGLLTNAVYDGNWLGRGGYTVNISEKSKGAIAMQLTNNRFFGDSTVISGGVSVDIGIPSTSRAVSTVTGNVRLDGTPAKIINA